MKSTATLATLTALLFAGAWFALWTLRRTEASMTSGKSSDLQKIRRGEDARKKIESWSAAEIATAKRGLLVDSALFVPLYAAFLVVGTLLVAQWWPFARHLAMFGAIGGLFDELENLCSFLELQGHYGVAPLTFTAMLLKSLCILAAFPACLPLIAILATG